MERELREMDKRISEIECRTAFPKGDEIENVLKLMKQYGVQRIHFGGMMIEMYRPEPAGTPMQPY